MRKSLVRLDLTHMWSLLAQSVHYLLVANDVLRVVRTKDALVQLCHFLSRLGHTRE